MRKKGEICFTYVINIWRKQTVTLLIVTTIQK